MAELDHWINSAGEGGNRNSMQYLLSTGTQTTFEFNFAGGYIEPAHVKAYIYHSASGLTTPISPVVLTGPNTIEVIPAVPEGDYLVVYRETPKTFPLVDFANGAVMDEDNLDVLAKQAIFNAAEMVDRFSEIKSTSDDAITRSYAAIQSANAAEASAVAANVTAGNAVNTAANAVSIANTAATTAGNAVTTANSAVGTANAATATANDASSVANGIDGKAQAALDNSIAAVNTANGIDAKAQQALDNSTSALSTAGTANSNATTALTKANSVEGIANTAKADAATALSTANAANTTASGALQRTGGTMTGELINTSGTISLRGFGADSNQAVVYLNAAKNRFLHYNGSQYRMDGAGLYVGGAINAGEGSFHTDGNIYGSTWGGWLSTWLNGQLAGKHPAGNYTHSNEGHKNIHWNGHFHIQQDNASGWHRIWTDRNLNPATAGAQVRHAVGVNEFGSVVQGPIFSGAVLDLPTPWVLTGLRVPTDTQGENRIKAIWLRGVWLINQ